MAEPTVENILQSKLTIKHGNYNYVFKIPSIKDRLGITARAAKLRQESDTEGNGIALGYDPSAVIISEKLAKFLTLLQETDAPWVYTPDAAGKPSMSIDNWADDVPVMEVVDQFEVELDKFRADRDKH